MSIAGVASDRVLKRQASLELLKRLNQYNQETEHSSQRSSRTTPSRRSGPLSSRGAPHLPPVSRASAAERESRNGAEEAEFGYKATDVTSKMNCAGLQWYQQASDDETPDRHSRRLQCLEAGHKPRRAQRTSLGGYRGVSSWSTETSSYGAAYRRNQQPEEGADGQQGASETASSISPRAEHGVIATDVTSKLNCAYLKWFNTDSSDESLRRLARRAQFAASSPGMAQKPVPPTFFL